VGSCASATRAPASRRTWTGLLGGLSQPQLAGLLLSGLGVLLSGCIERVTLGSECENGQTFCAPPIGAPPGMGNGAGLPPSLDSDSAVVTVPPPIDGGLVALDAGKPTTRSDAAEPIAAPDVAELLRNSSFELTRGSFGPLAYSLIDPIPIGTNLAEPWGACRTGFYAVERAESVRGSGLEDVRPREGESFIEAELNFAGRNGLRQTLLTPLRAGTRYGFRIDVRASVDDGDRALEVWGAQLDCVMANKLAEVGPIGSEGWQSVCVSFVPTVDVPQLMLVPTARGLGTSIGRVFFDNLRADPSCR
jgi:hypothetical protein